MISHTVKFQVARETPGTFMYRELDDQDRVIEQQSKCVIGSLYIRKSALRGVRPDKITITIMTE